MINKLKTIEYDLYLVLLGLLSFLSYIGLIDQILLPIYIVIAIVFVIFNKGVLYLIPIAIFMQMSFGGLRDNVRVTTIYSLLFVALIIFDVIRNRKITSKGKLFLPLVVFTVLSVITTINAPDLFTAFAGFTQIASVLILYVYFVNALEGNEITLINISKMFMYAGMIITFEMFHFIFTNNDFEPLFIIQRRMINLGWENLNIIIYTNIISIPLIGYLVLKSKVKLPYMYFALINIVGILLTLSRSSILTLAVFVALLVPYIIYKETDRKNLFIQGVIFLITVIIGLFLLEIGHITTDYVEILFGRDLLRYTDRWVLIEIAWEKLKEFPIFGSGGLYSSRIHLSENGALNYHNTIAQASTLGFAGIIALGYLFFEKTKLILSKQSDFKWILLVLIFVTAFVNGSLQPMYFYTSYMVFIFMILATYEKLDSK